MKKLMMIFGLVVACHTTHAIEQDYLLTDGINLFTFDQSSSNKISLNNTLAIARTNSYIIKSWDDLVTNSASFVGGVAKLKDYSLYTPNTSITVPATNRIEVGLSCVVRGGDKSTDGFVWMGAGDLFTVNTTDVSFATFFVVAPGATIFRLNGTPDTQAEIRDLIVSNANEVVDATGYDRFVFRNNLLMAVGGDALCFHGTNGDDLVIYDNIYHQPTTNTTWINVNSSAWDYVYIGRTHAEVLTNGGFFLEASTNSQNIRVGGFGFIRDVSFHGGNSPWTNISTGVRSSDLRWDISGVQDAEPSVSLGAMYMTNSQTLAIGGIGDYILVSNWTASVNIERFTVSRTNTALEYTGVSDVKVVGSMETTLNMASGTSQDFATQIRKNGVPLFSKQVAVSSGIPISMILTFEFQLKTGDYLDIWGANTGQDKDPIYENIKLIMKD